MIQCNFLAYFADLIEVYLTFLFFFFGKNYCLKYYKIANIFGLLTTSNYFLLNNFSQFSYLFFCSCKLTYVLKLYTKNRNIKHDVFGNLRFESITVF